MKPLYNLPFNLHSTRPGLACAGFLAPHHRLPFAARGRVWRSRRRYRMSFPAPAPPFPSRLRSAQGTALLSSGGAARPKRRPSKAERLQASSTSHLSTTCLEIVCTLFPFPQFGQVLLQNPITLDLVAPTDCALDPLKSPLPPRISWLSQQIRLQSL